MTTGTQNVYDFDDTILDGDSEFLFFSFLLENHLLSKEREEIVKALINAEELDEFFAKVKDFYVWLNDIEGLDDLLERFWDINIHRVKGFYFETRRDNDIISSATPTLILKPAFRRLGISTYFGTELVEDGEDRYKMRFLNRGEGKVTSLLNRFPNISIDNFYSDSDVDAPLAKLAKKAWKVRKDQILPWDFNE